MLSIWIQNTSYNVRIFWNNEEKIRLEQKEYFGIEHIKYMVQNSNILKYNNITRQESIIKNLPGMATLILQLRKELHTEQTTFYIVLVSSVVSYKTLPTTWITRHIYSVGLQGPKGGGMCWLTRTWTPASLFENFCRLKYVRMLLGLGRLGIWLPLYASTGRRGCHYNRIDSPFHEHAVAFML